MANNRQGKRSTLKESWRPLFSRLQSIKRYNDSPAIIRVTIVVDANGNPIVWLEPRVTNLEPKLNFDFTNIQKSLSPEDLLAILDAITRGE